MQFLTVVDVLMVLVIDMVVHSLEARRCGGLAGGRRRFVASFRPGVGAHHTGDELN